MTQYPADTFGPTGGFDSRGLVTTNTTNTMIYRQVSWDESTNSVPWHKSINLQFLDNLDVPDWGWCTAERTDRWGRTHYCDRPEDHTGRHLALERLSRYPVAVWS